MFDIQFVLFAYLHRTRWSLATPFASHAIQRNPMYLNLLLYLLAWAVYSSSWLALLFVPVFVLYIDQFQIRPEERALSSLFGPDYVAYKGRVRRWL